MKTKDAEDRGVERKFGYAVDVEDVWVTFRRRRGKEEVEALKELSFQIPKGEVFCLLGPNGSGKTTTVNVLNGLLKPTRGTAKVAGLEPTVRRKAVLRKIALVPQETALYGELTARENLLFHGDYYGVKRSELRPRIDGVLGLVRLEERQHNRVSTFSGGMQRRLALARALLSSPEILLLDEPTLGVDVQSRNAIWEQIRDLAEGGMTVLLTTNYMEEAEALGQRILILDRGRPVVEGSLEELKAQLARQTLLLRFTTTESASRARDALDGNYSVDRNERELTLRPGGPREAVRALREIPSRIGDAFEDVEKFELREPNLQDVFLHFTGRELRD